MGSFGAMFSKVREAIKGWGSTEPRVRLEIASVACPDPVDPNREPGFMCRAGEDVVCDGNWPHVICTAVEDIEIGTNSGRINEQFYWFQAPPEVGTDFLKIKCSICGGRWVSSGMHLHFKGGWR